MNEPALHVRITAPASLTELRQWVLWRRERGSKTPYRPDGRRASSTNPVDWSEYEDVLRELQRSHRFAGIGFVFSDTDPFCGIDLDDCLDQDGLPKTWARGVIERFADTYAETSPSGRGIKIWCKGRLPAAVGKVPIGDGGVEIYDRKRYFTVTGQAFRGSPLQIEDHAADIILLYDRLTVSRRGSLYDVPPDGRIPHGRQHLTLVSLCGSLRRRGVCEEAIRACLHAVNRLQCERPGPPANIDRIVDSSRRWRQPG